jgi:hypothetical protein
MLNFENMPGGHRAWRKRKAKKKILVSSPAGRDQSVGLILGSSYQRTVERKSGHELRDVSRGPRTAVRNGNKEFVKRKVFSDWNTEHGRCRSSDANFRLTEKITTHLLTLRLRVEAFGSSAGPVTFWVSSGPPGKRVVSDYGLDGRGSIPDTGRGFFL